MRPIPPRLRACERLGFRNPQAAIAAVRAWQSGRYRRHAQRAGARAADRIPALPARCLRPHRRTRSRARHLRQGDRRDAGGRAALLAACRQSEPAAADRRHHGHGAAARAHHRPPPAPARCRARSRIFRRGADAGQAQGAGRRGARPRQRDYQDALDRARIVGREQGFLIGVRVISGTLSARQAGAAYAGLAETLIEALAVTRRGRARAPARAPSRRAGGGRRHGQARRARDDRRLGPRPHRRLRLLRARTPSRTGRRACPGSNITRASPSG